MWKSGMDFSTCPILVVGDVMLDKYYFGKVERISPEAPVPIVNITREESRLGGASNVANNIASLGGKVTLSGAVGHDFFGKEIERMAHQRGIQTYFVKTGQPTITKARILGGKQQIVRLDYEQTLALPEAALRQYEERLGQLLPSASLLVISDYGKGLIGEALCRFLVGQARQRGIPVVIDPKGRDWGKYHGATLVTPNVKELGDIVGHPVVNEDAAIEEAGRQVLDEYRLEALLVTRSEKGMSLVTPAGVRHLPTHAEEVFDVSGAGDTVVATIALALAAGEDIAEAMRVANVAAGVVVRKIGTATLTREELEANL